MDDMLDQLAEWTESLTRVVDERHLDQLREFCRDLAVVYYASVPVVELIAGGLLPREMAASIVLGSTFLVINLLITSWI
jgi:hypothetical protein